MSTTFDEDTKGSGRFRVLIQAKEFLMILQLSMVLEREFYVILALTQSISLE